MSSCARTAAPQRYRVLWLTVSKICQSDFRRLTASTLASARPMYPTQRRPHSQLSEGLGKGRALTNSRTRGGKSFHAPQGEAREKNRNRAEASVRKLHKGRVGSRKTSPAGVQKAGAKMATTNYTISNYQIAIVRKTVKFIINAASVSSCARTAAPQRYRVLWLTVSKICLLDFR